MPRHETIRRARAARRAVRRSEDPDYQLKLEDDQVEQLARGECPELVALPCWDMLKWKREAARNRAREWHEAADRGRPR